MQTKEKHIYKIIFYFIVLICFTSISNTVFSIPKSVLNKDKSKRETFLFNADFSILIDILLDEKGNLFVADRLNHQIKNIDLQKSIILLVAGNGNDGYSGDGGKALEASISHPSAIALDNNNNLFIADDFKHCVRKVDLQTGLITTIVGIGESGFSGDGKLAIKSKISSPIGLAIKDKDLFISDTGNRRIRKVNLETGIISTAVGNNELDSNLKDKQIKARLDYPSSIAINDDNKIFIVDNHSQCIFQVDLKTNANTCLIDKHTTFDGKQIIFPIRLALGKEKDIFISEVRSHKILKLDVNTKQLITIAGNGLNAYKGDGGQATEASLAFPSAICFDDKNNNLFIADAGNFCVRKVDLDTGIITTVARNKKQKTKRLTN